MSELLSQENQEEKNVIIEKPLEQDIEGILNVQEENLFSELIRKEADQKKLSEKGFLISAITNEELKEIIGNPDKYILLVSKVDGTVVGYILGYDLEEFKRQDPEWEKSIILDDGVEALPESEKSLYLRHIAVRIGNRGVGTNLERKFFQEAEAAGYKYILGEILQEPVKNSVSLRFHEAIGFRIIGKVPEKKLVWNLVLKDLNKK